MDNVNPLFVLLVTRNRWLEELRSMLTMPALALLAVILVWLISASCLLVGEELKRLGLKNLVV
jgi:hypothetical protein